MLLGWIPLIHGEEVALFRGKEGECNIPYWGGGGGLKTSGSLHKCPVSNFNGIMMNRTSMAFFIYFSFKFQDSRNMASHLSHVSEDDPIGRIEKQFA